MQTFFSQTLPMVLILLGAVWLLKYGLTADD